MSVLDTEIKSVGQLFSNDYVFRFPRYQRPYRWTKTEAGQLFDDVRIAARLSETPGEDNSVFLGSILLVKGDGAEAQVVDGRQRLTTLAILLAVLRDQERPGEVKKELGRKLVGEGTLGSPVGPRLQPDGVDGVTLKRWVFDDGATQLEVEEEEYGEHFENLREAIDELRNRVGRLSVDKREFERFRDVLINNCQLVVVRSDDLARAFHIFEVMNARGMQLSEVDLFKPPIIDMLPEAERGKGAQAFEDADLRLGEKEMKVLLDSIYFLQRHEFPRKDRRESPKAAFARMKKYVENATVARRFVSDLERHAPLHAEILSAKNPDYRPIFDSLLRIAWRNRDWEPAALAILAAEKLSVEQRLDWLVALERFCYSFWLQHDDEEAGRDARLSHIQKTVEIINSGRNPDDKDALGMLDANKKQLGRVLLEPIGNHQKRRAIVSRVEACMSPSVVRSDITNAVVLQIKPHRVHPKSYWSDHFKGRTRTTHHFMIGNCALMPSGFRPNAGQYDWIARKSAIGRAFGATFQTAADLAGIDDWTSDVVESRTKMFADYVAKAWRL